MFKTVLFATAIVAVEAWHRDVKQDKFQTEAYGADNQYYGTQGYGGYANAKEHGHAGNASYNEATAHNSYRQSGHQGQGHNQWVDNGWNQWGTNNHYDTQKSVDNKWGNQSGKINVNMNSVSGHYDNDYGTQKRGMGYEGHQNVSGEVGYTIGLGGHSFGYDEGDHSFGYDNKEDYGYGGWANNLGSWNHGANYDNFGNQFVETGRDQYNDARDTANIKENRRVGRGYGDLEELDQEDDRQDQYANSRIEVTNRQSGTRNTLDLFAGRGDVREAGRGVDVADWNKQDIYDAQRGYGTSYGNSLNGYGRTAGYGGYTAQASYGQGLENGVDQYGDEAYGQDKGYGSGYADNSYGYAAEQDYDTGYGKDDGYKNESEYGYAGEAGYGKDDGYKQESEYGYSQDAGYGQEDYGYGSDAGYGQSDYGYGQTDYGYGSDAGYGQQW